MKKVQGILDQLSQQWIFQAGLPFATIKICLNASFSFNFPCCLFQQVEFILPFAQHDAGDRIPQGKSHILGNSSTIKMRQIFTRIPSAWNRISQNCILNGRHQECANRDWHILRTGAGVSCLVRWKRALPFITHCCRSISPTIFPSKSRFYWERAHPCAPRRWHACHAGAAAPRWHAGSVRSQLSPTVAVRFILRSCPAGRGFTGSARIPARPGVGMHAVQVQVHRIGTKRALPVITHRCRSISPTIFPSKSCFNWERAHPCAPRRWHARHAGSGAPYWYAGSVRSQLSPSVAVRFLLLSFPAGRVLLGARASLRAPVLARTPCRCRCTVLARWKRALPVITHRCRSIHPTILPSRARVTGSARIPARPGIGMHAVPVPVLRAGTLQMFNPKRNILAA